MKGGEVGEGRDRERVRRGNEDVWGMKGGVLGEGSGRFKWGNKKGWGMRAGQERRE